MQHVRYRCRSAFGEVKKLLKEVTLLHGSSGMRRCGVEKGLTMILMNRITGVDILAFILVPATNKCYFLNCVAL